MLLIVSNSQDITADYVAIVLQQHRVSFLRLDTDSILTTAKFHYDGAAPLLYLSGRAYRPRDFSNVWYRRPEQLQHPGVDNSPEGRFILQEWAEALEGFFASIPTSLWMNHPSRNVAASHKIEQLTRARSLGFRVPETLVTHDANELRTFYREHNEKIIAKPMADGYIERCEPQNDSQIYTNIVTAEQLDDLSDLQTCPTLFQEYIEKECDVRITVVEGDIHTVKLTARNPDGSQRCDVRRNNMKDVSYRNVALPKQIDQAIMTLMEQYRLRFAAIDMAISVHGDWFFFEVNPNGQWAWLDLAGVTDIATSFVKAFDHR